MWGWFLREIQIAAKLHHPHILPLYDSGAAGELLYYVIQQLAGGTGVVQWQDVGVVELGGDLDLAQKPLATQGRGDLLAEHLDGDRAVMPQVAAEQYHGHAPAAELPPEGVTVRQGGLESLLEVPHTR